MTKSRRQKWREKEKRRAAASGKLTFKSQAKRIREEVFSLTPDERREQVNGLIQQLRELLGQYDPLSIIGAISVTTMLHEARREPDEPEELYSDIEYIQSIATALSDPGSDPAPPAVIQAAIDLLKAIRTAHIFYQIVDAGANRDDSKEFLQLRYLIQNNTLAIRGDGYAYFELPLLREVFASDVHFLLEQYGFDHDAVINLAGKCVEAFESRVNRDVLRPQFDAADRLLEEFADENGYLPTPSSLNAAQAAKARRLVSDVYRAMNSVDYRNVLHCDLEPGETEVVKHLSLSFGDNWRFLDIEDWPGWPLNPTLVSERPFVEIGGKFFLPSPASFRYSLRSVIEGLIRRADDRYYRETYLPHRDQKHESRALDALAEVFGEANVTRNAFLAVHEGGTTKRIEIDGLAIAEQTLVIAETKAGILDSAARRGGKGVLDGLRKILGKASIQQRRVREYVSGRAVAVFQDWKGEDLLSLISDSVKEYVSITVTASGLGPVGPSPSIVDNLDVIERGSGWVVSLLDLQTIVHLLQDPRLFLDYVKKRIRLNGRGDIIAVDELDFLAYYFDDGLEGLLARANEPGTLLVLGSTQEFDEYFAALEGGEHPTKPTPSVQPVG